MEKFRVGWSQILEKKVESQVFKARKAVRERRKIKTWNFENLKRTKKVKSEILKKKAEISSGSESEG